MAKPTIDEFEVNSRGERGWVQDFLANLTPGDIVQAPYNKKSTALMLKHEASRLGMKLATVVKDGDLWVYLRPTADVAPVAEASANEAPRRRTAAAAR